MRDRDWYKKYFLNFFLILCLLQVMDYLSTLYIIKEVSVDVENNPLMRYVLTQQNGHYLMMFIKSIVMFLFLLVGWRWVNHPINFYKPKQQMVFKLLPIIIWFIYSVVVGLNLLGIIYVRFY